MVQLKYLSVFLVLLTQKSRSEQLNEDNESEESKKIILIAKDKRSVHKPFECDLALSEAQKKIMYYSLKSDASLDAYQWPKNREGHVIVPYQILKNAHYSKCELSLVLIGLKSFHCILNVADEQLKLIRRSMDEIEMQTCIRFRYRTHQHDFVNIYSGRFCKSNLGRIGGAQELSLNRKRCMEKGIIMHELLHALGYIHMHSRPDRDKYVEIQWKNILPQWFSEFNRVNPNIFMSLGTPYDYHSIMHYGNTAFTKNGAFTIIPKNSNYLHVIGQRGGLSEGDVNRINYRYKCKVDKPYPQLLNSLYSSSEFTSKPEYSLSKSIDYFSSELLPKPDYSFRGTNGGSSEFVPKTKFDFTKPDDDVDDLFNI
jgi:Astacin (Peptidase family M12A)